MSNWIFDVDLANGNVVKIELSSNKNQGWYLVDLIFFKLCENFTTVWAEKILLKVPMYVVLKLSNLKKNLLKNSCPWKWYEMVWKCTMQGIFQYYGFFLNCTLKGLTFTYVKKIVFWSLFRKEKCSYSIKPITLCFYRPADFFYN